MDKKIKECMKPHALAHMVSGAGIMLVLVSFFPALVANALMYGVIILVAAILFDFMVNKG